MATADSNINIDFGDGFQLGSTLVDDDFAFLEQSFNAVEAGTGLHQIEEGIDGVSKVFSRGVDGSVLESVQNPREYVQPGDHLAFQMLEEDHDDLGDFGNIPQADHESCQDRFSEARGNNVNTTRKRAAAPAEVTSTRKKRCKATTTKVQKSASTANPGLEEREARPASSLHAVQHDAAELAREVKPFYKRAGTTKKAVTYQVFSHIISESNGSAVQLVPCADAGKTLMHFIDMYFVLRVLMRAYELCLKRAGVSDPKYFEGFQDVLRTAQEIASGQRTQNKSAERDKLDTAWNTHKNDFGRINLKICEPPPKGTYKNGQEWVLSTTLWELPAYRGLKDGGVARECAIESYRQILSEVC
jgi:hypothetical protein